MDTLYSAFVNWQKELDGEADFWGLRYIRPGDGGLIWRNAAACEFFAKYGFFPAQTTPWAGLKAALGPLETARLETVYARAFRNFGKPLTQLVRSTASVTVEVNTIFIAVAGTGQHGILLTHYELSAVFELAQETSAQVA